MKRIGNVYYKLCDINNILDSYKEVMRTTRNKKNVVLFDRYKCIQVNRLYNDMLNETYVPIALREVNLYEPKKRIIVVQDIYDKIINHLVSRQILIPYLTKQLIDSNVASRKGYGTSYGRKLYFKYRNICDIKYNNYYILKLDTSKFFANINHNILKDKIRRKIKDKDVLDLLDKIIDNYDKGIPIGLMTSQIFAIFYLDSLDKYIKEVLKIKYYVRYQDDMILIHQDKEYLQYCLSCIKMELEKLDLEVNNKTRIYKNNENMSFIGVKRNGKLVNYQRTSKKVKGNIKKYENREVELSSVISSLNYLKGGTGQ